MRFEQEHLDEHSRNGRIQGRASREREREKERERERERLVNKKYD